MRKLQIAGLVGFAKRIRQELSGPLSAERLVQLRHEVEETVAGIEQIFREKRFQVRSLPAPSRRAFQFLNGLNLDSIVPEELPAGNGFAPDSVSFRGLALHFENLLDRWARAAQPAPHVPQPPPGPKDPSVEGPPIRGAAPGPKGRPLVACPQGHQGQRLAASLPAGSGVEGAGAPQGKGCHSALEEVYRTVVSDSERIEEDIRANHIRPEQLRQRAREMRGWFAFFARRDNFERYCGAVRRAEPVFRAACPQSEGLLCSRPEDPTAGVPLRVRAVGPAGPSVAVLVRFRPMHGMYRVRAYPDAILVDLPTPMISFPQDILRSVAQIAFHKGGDRQAVHEAAAGEGYRRIDSSIELLGGVVAEMRGLHHDLADSFDRVNAIYFHGGMSRPRLVWSRSFATRKFGHYEPAQDTIMVNAVLDRKTVPAFVVDFLVYHELLHKQVGIVWKSNRGAAHTAEFTERERQFKQYDEAKTILRKLASER